MRRSAVGFIFFMLISSISNAALIGRDLDGDLMTAEAYYDNDADLTWLADVNYARTSGYASTNATGGIHSTLTNIQVDGRMGWEAANTWATGLDVGGVSGWRLADSDGCVNNCTNSEMGNLFYNVLGNSAGFGGVSNTGPFINFHVFGSSWLATEYTFNSPSAWYFSLNFGHQALNSKSQSLAAWAVHDGEVGAALVPNPAVVWLFSSGLIGLVGLARRKKS